MIALSVLSAALAVAPTQDPAATSWRARQQWPVIAAAGVDSLGFYPQAAHPVGLLGTELTHVARRRFALVQPIELGYLYHRRFSHGPLADTGLEARWWSRSGIELGGGLGGGVEYVMMPQGSYVSDGRRYTSGRDPGRVGGRVKLTATIGYDFTRQTRLPLRLFARYQQVLLVPFAPRNGLPAMGRAQILFGLAVPLGKGK